ncbi:MAG: YjbQ family protein [Silicimonas sp.]|nr:YjbQ family protein [Silicimonas sp.]
MLLESLGFLTQRASIVPRPGRAGAETGSTSRFHLKGPNPRACWLSAGTKASAPGTPGRSARLGAGGNSLASILRIETKGPGLYEFTDRLAPLATGDGVMTLFVRHTSCSLLVQENADPSVQRDLHAFFQRLAPHTNDPSMHWVTHRSEGPDDMPAHIKSAVLPVSLSIPVQSGRLMLGTWQGVYLFEHRDRPHSRQIAVALT